jgi:DNA-directed RNA polymerase subunit RPC12/RpoP
MTFQNGQSGNPAGRPRGARGKPAIVIELSSDTDAASIVRAATHLIKAGDMAGAKACLRKWLYGPIVPPSPPVTPPSPPVIPPSPSIFLRSKARRGGVRRLHARCDAIEAALSQRAQAQDRPRVLTLPELCSHFVPMTVTTLGQAWRLGWRLRARCFWLAPGAKSARGRQQVQCETSTELDMKTLVWTRGEAFPLDQLESRLKCPRCGSRRVTVVFEVPNQPRRRAGEGAV